jgi:uncharacterized repeat protein (TIGR03803 family)
MKTLVLWCLATSLASLSFCVVVLGQSTETVLYSFGAYPTDGVFPEGGLLFDSQGNIYGTTNAGGANCEFGGCGGTIYELSPTVGGGWTETILYNFCSTGNSSTCPDGSYPLAGLIMDAQGNLYGTTAGGGTGAEGIVFRLSPPSVQGGSWTQTVLWTFLMSPENGTLPWYGKLNMDASGNIYGTTLGGGSKGLGTVFELSPLPDGTYFFSIQHSFSGNDGIGPEYGVTFDSAGNLYGTAFAGGRGKSICNQGCGLVYKLTPSGGAWQETVLYEFDRVVGAYPISPVSIDRFGNLYGTFEHGGTGICLYGTCGGVFKLVPGTGRRYAFHFNGNDGLTDGEPQNGVAVGTGNTVYGAVGVTKGGDVYMLQNSQETILYNFCSLPNCADGSVPAAGNIVIHQGALYGATVLGGLGGGVVYSVTK